MKKYATRKAHSSQTLQPTFTGPNCGLTTSGSVMPQGAMGHQAAQRMPQNQQPWPWGHRLSQISVSRPNSGKDAGDRHEVEGGQAAEQSLSVGQANPSKQQPDAVHYTKPPYSTVSNSMSGGNTSDSEMQPLVKPHRGHNIANIRIFREGADNDANRCLGMQIHVAPRQKKYLPYEAGDVIQQKQARVKPPLQINNDKALEKEADIMGSKGVSYQTKQIATNRVSLTSNLSSQIHKHQLNSLGSSNGIIQTKQFYEDIQNSGQDPALYNYQRQALNQDMQRAVDNLRDNATMADAQAAMQAVFGPHPGRPPNHNLGFVGTSVFLDSPPVPGHAGGHIDRLGTLADDQDANMYIQVPAAVEDVNTLWVNKSSGQEHVRDANNLFTPRFQSRSITVADRGRINQRNSVQGTHPLAHANPLQHVGGANSPYISMSAGLDDVTNAHGVPFNANNTGRITADMLQVPAATIVDLHATQGAQQELGNRMAQNIKDSFPAIWNAAHTQVAAIHAAPAAGKVAAHAAARANRPPAMQAGQDQQWQQLLDAVRTKEVLVHQNLPFDAITAFGNSGEFALAPAATAAIAVNSARSQARTAAATAELAAHQQPVALCREMDTALRQRLNHSKATFKAAAQAAIGPLPATQREARYTEFNTARDNTKANLQALADLYQQRISGGVYGVGAPGIPIGVAAFIAEADAIINENVAGV
ncbi:MAG: hypothetical protein KDJ52_06695 [Anaerolineae bacterium]|nr:hypothetical protein [Anaerolineae bacterium]